MSEPPSTKPESSSSPSPKMKAKVGSGFPNPPESVNPDSAALREQWRFAIKQYSKWYSNAWGTAILAGLSFFALGWVIKGHNPLDSFKQPPPNNNGDSNSAHSPAAEVRRSG